jgi:hypothetical protein
MTEQGFEEHPPLIEPIEDERTALGLYAPRPTRVEAEEVGFRNWLPFVFQSVDLDKDPATWKGNSEPEPWESLEYEIARYGRDAALAYAGVESPEVSFNASGEALDWPGEEIHVIENDIRINWNLEGCEGRAVQALFGDDPYDFMRAQALATGAAWEFLPTDEKIVAADIAWGACMAEHGYEGLESVESLARTLTGLRQSLLYEPMGDAPMPSESSFEAFEAAQIDLAVADAECSEQTGHGQVLLDVFYQRLAENMLAFEVELFAYQEEAGEVLAVAQDLIANGQFES